MAVADANRPAVRTTALGRRFDRVQAVRDVTFEIARGEIFGIVGPDGAGKSTLIQMLCGILDPSAGSAEVLGFDTVRQASRLVERVGYMSQNFSLYGNLSVAENLEFFADLRFVPPAERARRAKRLFEFSRLTPFADRLAKHLSGGMQKKLALATTLIHDPEILFLDEPTTGVDPVSRRDFWEIVFDFLREGVTVVVATPYLDEAERCERVALMQDGRILMMDTPAALKERLGGQMAEIWTPEPARALAALRADPAVRDAQIFGGSLHALLTETAAYRGVEQRLAATGIEIDAARCIDPTMEDVFVALLGSGNSTPLAELSLEAVPGVSDGPAIRVENLAKHFGAFTAVDGISFSVGSGEVFGFLGPNGSGKSTTIRMLTGILAPSAGSVHVAGFDVARDLWKVRPLMGYVSQRFSLYDDLTISENLEFFAGLYGVPAAQRSARKRWALSTVGLDMRGTDRPCDLAGGFRQRLALAAAIQHRPRILLLDEPTSGVDALSRRQFWDLIFALAHSGVTVLVTTHYMDEAERCDRLALLDRGRILAAGTPRELRAAIGGRMIEILLPQPIAALRVARTLPGVRQCTLYGARLHVLLRDASEATLVQALRQAGHNVEAAFPVPLAMEDVFAALIGESRAETDRAA